MFEQSEREKGTGRKDTYAISQSELSFTRGEEGWGEGIVREFGTDMYTLLYLKWITNKGLLYSLGNSAQYYATT